MFRQCHGGADLLPVEIELVLRDGALPDALGQRLGLAEPHVHVDAAGIEGPEKIYSDAFIFYPFVDLLFFI
jgi:hypothetical protein